MCSHVVCVVCVVCVGEFVCVHTWCVFTRGVCGSCVWREIGACQERCTPYSPPVQGECHGHFSLT